MANRMQINDKNTSEKLAELTILYTELLSLRERISQNTLTAVKLRRKGVLLRRLAHRLVSHSALNVAVISALRLNERASPRQWAILTESTWWDHIVPAWDSATWKENFRLKKETVQYIALQIAPGFEHVDTNYRKSIPLFKRTAIAVYTLCSNAEYKVVSSLFGVGKSTICRILHNFCNCVTQTFMRSTIRFPCTSEDLENARQGFDECWDIPQCIGALDSCHIPVSPPKEEALDYHNYKGWYSIILMAVCDYRHRFTYINVGAPGRSEDAHVFYQSSLPRLLANNLHDSPLSSRCEDVTVPLMVLADSAFPLGKHVMKPYSASGGLDIEQIKFNYHLSRALAGIENTFERLKARFRITSKRIEAHVSYVPTIIQTCCILHNICDDLGDEFDDQWMCSVIPMPGAHLLQEQTTIGEDDHEAQEIRNALKIHLSPNI